MAAVSESILVGASLAETWDHYFDPHGWPAWVEGFAAVESADGYPEAGSELVWTSTPAGRGTVRERVIEHQPRQLHRIAFSDPESSGELLTRFAVEGKGTRVTLELTYRIGGGGLLANMTDRVFVRGQVVRSLQRALLRLRVEVEELAEAGEPVPASDQ